MNLVKISIVGRQIEYVNPSLVKRVKPAEEGEWCYIIFSNDSHIMVKGSLDEVVAQLNGGAQRASKGPLPDVPIACLR
jgi:hypothetical protein